MVRGKSNDGRQRMSVEPKVVAFLRMNAGIVVTLDDLMGYLPSGANPASVRGAMRRLVEGEELDISVVSRGNSWRLESLGKPDTDEKANPNAGKSLGLFEQVGEMQDGSLVVRDEDNRLYALKAL